MLIPVDKMQRTSMRRRLLTIVFGIGAGVLTATAAAAQCCLGFVENCTCGPSVIEPPLPGPMYVVNQGPVHQGPGPVLWQPRELVPPYAPYVGYVYSGYPYGIYRPGYPRGLYNPYVGYPYADPPPPRYRYRAAGYPARRHW